MQTGLIALTCGIRIIGLQQLFYTVTIGKIKSVIALMEIGAVPGLEVVDMEQFTEKFPISVYWAHLVLAGLSGVCMAFNSKLSHVLCRNPSLRHEAYLGFYSSLMVVVSFPAFIGVAFLDGKKREMTQE